MRIVQFITAGLAAALAGARRERLAQEPRAHAAFRRCYPDYRIPEALRDQVMAR